MDSTTCLYKAKADGYEVVSLGIDYGQRLRIEMLFAERQCSTLGVLREIVSVSWKKPTRPIHLVDRSPLDPLTFGTSSERPEKARALIDKITDNDNRNIEPGHIIFLDCDLADVKVRSSLKHKYWSDEQFSGLLSSLSEVYGSLDRSVVCTRGRTATQVAHEIAKVVFLDKYNPVDIRSELSKHADRINAAA